MTQEELYKVLEKELENVAKLAKTLHDFAWDESSSEYDKLPKQTRMALVSIMNEAYTLCGSLRSYQEVFLLERLKNGDNSIIN